MTPFDGLTAEQEIFAFHVGGAFVHACPGAGKTRTIVARLAKIYLDLPPRRGIAVLSFTNSAVDEFRKRCREARLDTFLKHPSFMGTLDAFVRHFLVLPGYEPNNNKRPIILDSWDSLGVEIRLSGQYFYQGDGISLDLFDPATNIIDPAKIGQTGLRNHVLQYQNRYQQAATNRRHGLINAGYLSVGDARLLTSQIIRDPIKGSALGKALAARFIEVIVDEGQDCNPFDLEILTWLRQNGIHVTFVCDPDQAIYEFRNGNPVNILTFKETYSIESQLKLTGNFRSSPAICRLAATLRSIGDTDESLGDSAHVAHPILLITYIGRGNAAIGRTFLDWVSELGHDTKDAIVLAHSGKVSRRATGVELRDLNGNSRIESLARKVAEFRSSAATARSRESVIQAVELLLLDLMGLLQKGEHLLHAVERANLDRRLFRRHAIDFLVSLPEICDDSDAHRLAWISTVHAQIGRLGLVFPAGVTVRRFFPRPPNGQWVNHLQVKNEFGLPCAKIHESKGREYGAVCVVIPPNNAANNRSEILFESWSSRIEIETKRVIYVGVTRARNLGALAIPIAYADRCVTFLDAGHVPYTRINLSR